MDPVVFDTLTRRASLVAMGAVGIAALASPIASEGKKKRKKNGDVNKLCKPQVAQCETFYNLPADCNGNSFCLKLRACCALFGTCDLTGFFDCRDAN